MEVPGSWYSQYRRVDVLRMPYGCGRKKNLAPFRESKQGSSVYQPIA